jgi:hypothetical protein
MAPNTYQSVHDKAEKAETELWTSSQPSIYGELLHIWLLTVGPNR